MNQDHQKVPSLFRVPAASRSMDCRCFFSSFANVYPEATLSPTMIPLPTELVVYLASNFQQAFCGKLQI
jgi:hypothetical protein